MAESLFHEGVIAACFFTLYLLVISRLRSPPTTLPYPPGPKPLPILGNALDLPRRNPQQKYRQWRQHYGEIVHLTAAKQHILIVNTPKAAFDLLEKRGKIYSDRPASVMVKMIGLDDTWTLLPYGETLRSFRRLGRQFMGVHAIRKYQSIQEEEARSFAKSILVSPSQLQEHVNRTTSTIMLRLLYGYSPSKELDSLSSAAQQLASDAAKMLSASSRILDIFPLLRHVPSWFPLFSFKRKAADIGKTYQYVFDEPFEMVSCLHSPATSLCGTLLEDGKDNNLEKEHLVKMFLGSAYPPGQETTAATLIVFFLLMAKYPEVQERAREEILSITGDHRLPTLADKPGLSYLLAVLKEILRWHAVTPLGTIVFPNIWEILHDPDRYEDPFSFKPERFLAPPFAEKDGYPYDPFSYVFGFGRRSCPGMHLAENSLLIIIATVLVTCCIEPCRDEDGSPINMEEKFSPTLVSIGDLRNLVILGVASTNIITLHEKRRLLMKLKRELGNIDAMGISTDLPRSKRRKQGSSAMSPPGNANIEIAGVTNGEAHTKDDKSLVKEQGFKIYNAVVNAKGEGDRVLSYDFQHLPPKRTYADYYILIAEPIALDGIKAKLDRGAYSSLEDVKHDFDTCFRNAKKYNMKDSQIWRDAKDLHRVALEEYMSIAGPNDNIDILGSESDENDNDNDGDYEGEGKNKSPKGRRGRPISVIRLMRIRMQKLVEKTDDDGRLITEAFMELPDKKTYPIYYKTIKRLMCFETILKRIKRKEYTTISQFAADVELVFSNALTFNEEHSSIWEDAMTLKNYFRELMSDLPSQFALPEYSLNAKPLPVQNGKLKLRLPAFSPMQAQSTTENTSNGAGTSLKVKLPPLAAANVPMAAAAIAPAPVATQQPASSAPTTRQQAATKATPNIAPHPPLQPPLVPTPGTTYLQPMTYSPLHPHQPQPQYQYHQPNMPIPQSTVNSISPSPSSSTPVSANVVFDHPLHSMILKTMPLGRTIRLDSSEGVRTWVLRLSKGETKLDIREVKFLEDEESDEDEEESVNTSNSGKGEVFVKANGILITAKIPNIKEGEGIWEVSELKPGANTLEVGEQSGEVWKIVLQRPLVKM
ncbi:hypothetical protein Clacol_007618 [Clathrus columnatus]|uniref:Bromo domain-containing protein n=1 Tax=Clathrus columnatus TaxID=1419009 RepID=A0AAV5AFE5_9AGAM|nr:hypothetical protein Clacol_007618 [Clathrus columnatus]